MYSCLYETGCSSILKNHGTHFVPLSCLCSWSSSTVVEALLRGLADVHKETVVYECALGAALLATLDCLVRRSCL